MKMNLERFIDYRIFLILLQVLHFPLFSQVRFTDVTQLAGIHFKYNFGDDTYENILESSGSGVTVFDYDGDGDMDLYLLNGTYLEDISDPEGRRYNNTRDELYRNNGNGSFTEVSQPAGLNDLNWSMAASWIDLDSDHDNDLYLMNYGQNVFYRNNGNGTFTDITASLGLHGPGQLNGFTKWTIGAVWFDYNQDGLTDLLMGNFLAFDPDYISTSGPGIMPHPSEYKGQASLLYRQEKNGRFTEATQGTGLYFPDSKCMGLTLFDEDGDGNLDIFQANDHQLNFLFLNQGNGTFRETAIRSGVAGNDSGKPTGSMHGTLGDVDGDGLTDILVGDLEYGALYRNLGNGLYEDITRKSNIDKFFAGKGQWAVILFDYDNDGDPDIFAANGNGEELILQLPLLLENDGTGVFTDAGPKSGPYFTQKRSGRGAAVWDYDDDGDLDLIVSHVDLQRTPVLLKNEGGNRNHWIGLTLMAKNGQVAAQGAKVEMVSYGKKYTAINQWVTSYLSSHDPRLHFGLGKSDQVDQVEIFWPNGQTELYLNLEIDKYHLIEQGKGIKTD